MMAMLRNALVDESGATLMAKYPGLDDFFTPEGYAAFADDLLARMVNPLLARYGGTRRARPGAQAGLE